MHWKIKHGKVLPQNLRKKNRSRMTDVMGMFGMKPREIQKLKNVFPELDEVMATKTDAQRTLLIVTKAIALRAVANPTPNTAKALMILSEPLINDSPSIEEPEEDFWDMET